MNSHHLWRNNEAPEQSAIIYNNSLRKTLHMIYFLLVKWFKQYYLLSEVSSFFPISLLSAVDVVGAAGWVLEALGATHLSLAPMGTAGWVKEQFGVLHDAP